MAVAMTSKNMTSAQPPITGAYQGHGCGNDLVYKGAWPIYNLQVAYVGPIVVCLGD